MVLRRGKAQVIKVQNLPQMVMDLVHHHLSYQVHQNLLEGYQGFQGYQAFQDHFLRLALRMATDHHLILILLFDLHLELLREEKRKCLIISLKLRSFLNVAVIIM